MTTIAEERKQIKQKVLEKIREFLESDEKRVFKVHKYVAILSTQSRVKNASLKKEINSLLHVIFDDQKYLSYSIEDGFLIKHDGFDWDLFDESKVLFTADEMKK